MKVVAANSGSGATMNIRIEDVAENVTQGLSDRSTSESARAEMTRSSSW